MRAIIFLSCLDQNEKSARYRCSVTPCSALSQASCRSPDDRRGAALLAEEVGGHVGVTICKKSPTNAAMAITVAKCQEVVTLHHEILAIADFAMLFGGIGESGFLSKKVPKWYKRLKDLKMETEK